MGLMDFSLGDIGSVFTGIREAITGEKILDPAEMAKIELQLKQLESLANEGQISINKVEAAHKNIFVSGWRPFIGWVCGTAIAYAYVGQPLLEWGVMFAGYDMAVQTITQVPVIGSDAIQSVVTWSEGIRIPEIETDRLFELVLAMLGMATLRTYEKEKGIARED